MQLAMIGLGRMGGDLVRRLMADGHDCVVHDLDPAAVAAITVEGASGIARLGDLGDTLPSPRIIWVMVPAAAVTAAGEG